MRERRGKRKKEVGSYALLTQMSQYARHHILLTTVEARDGGQYKTKMYSRGVSSKEGRSCAGWEELCWVGGAVLGGRSCAGWEELCWVGGAVLGGRITVRGRERKFAGRI